MHSSKRHNEHGQALVIVAMSMLAFLAFLGLALDGGMTYAKRRVAQNAADAGALAGARYLCGEPDILAATDAAEEYAITRNGADTADVTFPFAGNIRVVTSVTSGTFFTWALGRSEIKVEAAASATCTPPSNAKSVLPSAYPCDPPEGEEGDSEDCEVVYGDPTKDDQWHVDNQRMVILMDSEPSTAACEPDGTIDCDPDGDGIPNIRDTAARGWVDLDGGSSNSNELVDWILNGYDETISAHTWLGRMPGVTNAVFNAVSEREGDNFIIPIFDQFCNPSPPSAVCPDLWHADDTEILRTGTGHTYYHIIAFAKFHVVCVHSDGADKIPNPEGEGKTSRCPYRRNLHLHPEDYGYEEPILTDDPNIKTIEGYFLEGTESGLGGGGGIDFGLFVIVLTE